MMAIRALTITGESRIIANFHSTPAFTRESGNISYLHITIKSTYEHTKE